MKEMLTSTNSQAVYNLKFIDRNYSLNNQQQQKWHKLQLFTRGWKAKLTKLLFVNPLAKSIKHMV